MLKVGEELGIMLKVDAVFGKFFVELEHCSTLYQPICGSLWPLSCFCFCWLTQVNSSPFAKFGTFFISNNLIHLLIPTRILEPFAPSFQTFSNLSIVRNFFHVASSDDCSRIYIIFSVYQLNSQSYSCEQRLLWLRLCKLVFVWMGNFRKPICFFSTQNAHFYCLFVKIILWRLQIEELVFNCH